LASNIHPFALSLGPLATEQKSTINKIIQIHLWNPWEHGWELEKFVGNMVGNLRTLLGTVLGT